MKVIKNYRQKSLQVNCNVYTEVNLSMEKVETFTPMYQWSHTYTHVPMESDYTHVPMESHLHPCANGVTPTPMWSGNTYTHVPMEWKHTHVPMDMKHIYPLTNGVTLKPMYQWRWCSNTEVTICTCTHGHTIHTQHYKGNNHTQNMSHTRQVF